MNKREKQQKIIDQLDEKIIQLRTAKVSETNAAVKFQLETQIQEARAEKDQIIQDIEDEAKRNKRNQEIRNINTFSNIPHSPQPGEPNTTNSNSSGISRRQFFKWAGFGGVGLGTVVLIPKFFELFQTSQSPQPETFRFETVTVNAQGVEINRRNGEAKYFVENLGNNLPLEMVQIPGGTFTMGSPPGEAQRENDEGPQHKVTVPKFFMGKYAVTQAQYQAVMGENPSNFKGETRPVERVSWNNAVEFCKRLTQKTGRTYRLPSEAEWEYACRAGTTTPFHFGETITTDLVNFNGSYTYASAPKGEYRQQTVDVDVESFFPNPFGLYQMHGNILEWCLDTWHDNYQKTPSDGSAWIGDNQANVFQSWEQFDRLYLNLSKNNCYRLLRGGSWDYDPRSCRSTVRFRGEPDDRNYAFGFRVSVARSLLSSL